MLDGFSTRSAEAICTFAYCWSLSEDPIVFQGKCNGTIPHHPQGTTSFGWDNIFIPIGLNER